MKIYFQKTRQIIIENAKHFAKTDKSLLGHPERNNAVIPDKATLWQRKLEMKITGFNANLGSSFHTIGRAPIGTTQLSLIKRVVKVVVGENTNCGTRTNCGTESSSHQYQLSAIP